MIQSNSSTSSSSQTDLQLDTPAADADERLEARKVARGLLLFGLPFFIYGLLVLLVDPFRLFPGNNIIPEHVKQKISYILQPCVYKMVEYERSPCPRLLLGDSRMLRIPDAAVSKVTGQRYSNMAYGGGTLQDVCDTFYYCQEQIALEKVYIGVNVDSYNDFETTERANLYPQFRKNPLLYFSNRSVAQATSYCFAYSILGSSPQLDAAPVANSEAYWAYHLNEVMRRRYKNFTPPKRYFKLLKELATNCRQNNIDLAFVIFPSHSQNQALIAEYGLTKSQQQMKQELGTLGNVVDLENIPELTNDRSAYRDSIHFLPVVSEQIVQRVWGGTK
jgi:hypothetical protein